MKTTACEAENETGWKVSNNLYGVVAIRFASVLLKLYMV